MILHDMRADSRYTRAQRILQHGAELTGLQYHPTMTNIFATSDNRGHVCLRDIRMAFGPLPQRRDEGIVHKVSFLATGSVACTQGLMVPTVHNNSGQTRRLEHGSTRG